MTKRIVAIYLATPSNYLQMEYMAANKLAQKPDHTLRLVILTKPL